ncbi:MAG: YncE family protein [Bacilli bacterium]
MDKHYSIILSGVLVLMISLTGCGQTSAIAKPDTSTLRPARANHKINKITINGWRVAKKIPADIYNTIPLLSIAANHTVVMGMGSVVANSHASMETLSLVDTGQRYARRTISLGYRGILSSLVSTPNGQLVIAASSTGAHGLVSVLNIHSLAVSRAIAVGEDPHQIVVTPHSRFAFVMNAGGNTVTEIDLRTDTVVQTIKVGATPISMVISPNGRYLYVLNSGVDGPPGSLSIFDRSTGNIKTVIIQRYMYHMAITPDGGSIVATNPSLPVMYVVGTGAGNRLSWIDVGKNLSDVIASPVDSHIVAAFQQRSNHVLVVNIATKKTVLTVPVQSGISALTFTPAGDHLLVLTSGSDNPPYGFLKIISLKQPKVTSIPIGFTQSFAISRDGKMMAIFGGSSGNELIVLKKRAHSTPGSVS